MLVSETVCSQLELILPFELNKIESKSTIMQLPSFNTVN